MRNKIKENKLRDMENKLAELCEDIYLLNTNGKRIIPLHPWILVRVLPKEHKTASGLFLPGNVANKPVYEGIVLETWQPYTETRTKGTVMRDYFSVPVSETIIIEHTCDLKRGDRVLFPHYEGQPLPDFLDDKYYRMIREGSDQNKTPYCSVYGTIDYQGDGEKVKELKKVMEKFGSITMSGTTDPRAPHWEPPSKSSMFTS